jgi:putative aldouronate transport system permease protein
MRNYFIFVPHSLAESSRLDGASELKIFTGIYLPLSIPGLATVFFMEFVAKWNSIMLPATLVTNQELFTLPLMLKSLIIQTEVSTSGTAMAPNNAIMAAVLISTAPLLLIYIFAQQFLISGLSLGSSKE